jgi:hypothetical protein
MFDRLPDYPMAVPASSGPDKSAVQLALQWRYNITDDVGGRPLITVPTQEAVREWPILAKLDGCATVATWKSPVHAGGAVLALWPDAEHLARVTDDPGTRPVRSALERSRCGRVDPCLSPGHAAADTEASNETGAGDHLRPGSGKRARSADRHSKCNESARE